MRDEAQDIIKLSHRIAEIELRKDADTIAPTRVDNPAARPGNLNNEHPYP